MYSVKRGDVKSSTMKGPQGLAGKFSGRRCRNAHLKAEAARGDGERPWPKGKGGASIFCPLKWRSRVRTALPKLCRGGSPDIRPEVIGVTPDSHVTQKTKEMANAGRAPAAGLVVGAWVLSPTCLKCWSLGVGPK